jgi:uncharacterized protein (TIGR03435 family)
LESPLVCVSGITGSNLNKRIEAIMSDRAVLELKFTKRAALAATGLAALAAPIVIGLMSGPMVRAHSTESPPAAQAVQDTPTAPVKVVVPAATPAETFDVASVKPDTSGAGGFGYPGLAPGRQRFTATNLPLTALILLAYDATPGQITGVPHSLDATGWDIEAKCDHPMAKEQALRMLQALLADRFKLTLHREMREQPVYALVVAKGGPKLRESLEESPVPVMQKTSNGGFVYKGAPISTLTLVLSQQVGRFVIDKTQLKGRYDFTLEYERERPVRPGADSTEPASNPGRLPSVFNALQEQLGLKLESQKGPVEFLIVDHAEKPSAN